VAVELSFTSKSAKMTIEKHKLHNESPILRKIRLLTYPVIFSILSVFNAKAEELKNIQLLADQTAPVPARTPMDEQTTAQRKSDTPIDAITDSTFIKSFEGIFNKLTKADLSDTEREKLNKDIINRLAFFFNESGEPADAITADQMYVKRKNDKMPQKLQWFLENFYKESYRSSGSLSVKILSIYQKDKKIYIEYDYVYTPKEEKAPKDSIPNTTIPKDTIPQQ